MIGRQRTECPFAVCIIVNITFTRPTAINLSGRLSRSVRTDWFNDQLFGFIVTCKLITGQLVFYIFIDN